MIKKEITMLIVILLFSVLSNIFATSQFVIQPLSFVEYKSNGGLWNISEKGSTTLAGLGVSASTKLNNWNVAGTFIAVGISGKIHNKLFDFSSRQGLPFLDSSKDGTTHWVEIAKTKISYNQTNFTFEFGKFDRQWGSTTHSILISNKSPSYPQFGFDWDITSNLRFIYFHGFLKSQIPDSVRADTYHGIGKRSFDLPRSIAGHRLEWSPTSNLTLGATESVVYGSRQIDFHYLMPFTSLWHMENHLGDIDNAQVGLDVSCAIKENSKLYFSLYIDEWTPEWTFKNTNHNWFAYQTGFNWKNIIRKFDKLTLEYTWTDHRIYRHRFPVNNYYSHGYPLGFWAGPHSEDVYVEYHASILNSEITLRYSDTKRGQLTDKMLEDQYEDVEYERYSGGAGYEHRKMVELLIHRYYLNNQVEGQFGLEYIDWHNAGFDPFDPDPEEGNDVEKWSLVFNVFYNFKL